MNHEHVMNHQHSFKLHLKRLIKIKGESGNYKSADQVVKK